MGIAHHPSLRAGFIWDDDDYVTENETLRSAEGLGRIWFDPGAIPQYYPLVHTSYWLEHRLWGLRPLGYHLVNILLHLAVSALLLRLLTRLRVPGAFVASLAFAVHPVGVETVAWITERKNLLSALFYLLSLDAYLRYAGVTLPGGARGGRRLFAVALLTFLAALLAKTVAATLPAAVLLILWWKRGRIRFADAIPLAPFFAAGITLGLVTLTMERSHVGAQGSEFAFTLLERVAIAGRASWFYLGKILVPLRLAFIYPRWTTELHGLEILVPAVGFLALLAAAILFRRRLGGRGPATALLFFAGTLAPALGFFNVYPMRYSFVADHFQYLASASILALIARAGASAIERASPRVRRAAVSTAAVWIGSLALLAAARSHVFLTEESVWEDTLRKNPACWMAHHNLAMLDEKRGDDRRAAERYRSALHIRSDLPQTEFNLGGVLARMQEWEGAQAAFEASIRLAPGYADAHVSLGNVLVSRGELEPALACWRRALALDPANEAAARNLRTFGPDDKRR